ncbi:MAG: PTS sugar transporter subunit IIC [Desulfovibrionaceae bacterium]
MTIPAYYALVALCFTVFTLFRYSFSVGLLERPLVVGLFWGLVSGHWEIAMAVAIFFELAWLDLIPAGSFIPPHLTAATLAALALTSRFSLEVPGEIMVAMLASVPLAWVGSSAEDALRTFNSRTYDQAAAWANGTREAPFPSRLLLRSILITAGAAWGGFFALILALHFVVGLVLPNVGFALARLEVTWPHLWLGASLGGLLALRLRRAYVVCAVCATVVFFLAGASMF